MSHILRAHQLCMEGYSTLFDRHLSTVWSAPNYCYRCGNSASILEVGPGERMYFNVFEAAPENEHDGPSQQATAQNAPGGKVRKSRFRSLLVSSLTLHVLIDRMMMLIMGSHLSPSLSRNNCPSISCRYRTMTMTTMSRREKGIMIVMDYNTEIVALDVHRRRTRNISVVMWTDVDQRERKKREYV